ncbi:nuclear transport factor 2 family protein [Pseudoalteromonas sp. MMG005]|uniref:nuclear transport factor 2 family protein n=1 Tax=Pseudoalteromonas sp. MMG005 TaxID=2822682 RepID=UPI001B3A5D86|nr:nuclear transport factor 2 family protein [Pseudoalteromonas sp. MMG005]
MHKLLLIVTLLLYSLPSLAKVFSEAQLTELANAFVAAKNARQQPDTDIEDIDHYLSLLADTFIDEHIKYNVVINSKTELRNSLIAKMTDKVIFSSIRIVEKMVGSNVVFIKMIEVGKVKPSHSSKVIDYESINIVSLEFNDKGLIKHIRRHHGF